MPHLHITPRRVAPYVISGVTGVHILTRMHRLSRQPATDTPLQSFLLKNTDVVLALGGASIAIWQIAQQKPRDQSAVARPNDAAGGTLNKSVIAGIVHQLRQVFTSLLLGLGLINRKVESGNTQEIPSLVQRLKAVILSGIDAINVLDSDGSTTGHEREYGA